MVSIVHQQKKQQKNEKEISSKASSPYKAMQQICSVWEQLIVHDKHSQTSQGCVFVVGKHSGFVCVQGLR